MKKILFLILIIAPLLTGCTNIETRVTINNNKSVQVASSLTYKGNLSDPSDKNAVMIMNYYENFLNNDYKVTTAYGSKFSTITGTKKVDNILKNNINLSSLGINTKLESGKFIEIKKNFLVTSYNIDAEIDYPSIISGLKTANKEKNIIENEGLTPEYLKKYGDLSEMPSDNQGRVDFAANLDDSAKDLFSEDAINEDDKPINPQKEKDEDVTASFSIELPSFAYYSNADSTDGNIYTWNIKKYAPTEIRLQYMKYSGFAIFSLISIGALLLIYLAYRILRHDARKRIGTDEYGK